MPYVECCVLMRLGEIGSGFRFTRDPRYQVTGGTSDEMRGNVYTEGLQY